MPEQPPYLGTPRWVVLSGIILVVAILLVGIMLFTGVGGPHGPRRHTPFQGPPGGAGDRTPPSSFIEGSRSAVTLVPTHRLMAL